MLDVLLIFVLRFTCFWLFLSAYQCVCVGCHLKCFSFLADGLLEVNDKALRKKMDWFVRSKIIGLV